MQIKFMQGGVAATLGATLMFSAFAASAAEMVVAGTTITQVQPADAEISQQIAAVVSADQRIRGTQLQVSTSRGIVSLSGRVETVAMIYRTVELARRVNGVRAVNDDGLIQASY
jgi:osmotically-inducible protein OsmY